MRLWPCPLHPSSLNNLPLGGLVLSSIERCSEQLSHCSPENLARSEQFNLSTMEIASFPGCCAAQRAGIDTLYSSRAHDGQCMTAYTMLVFVLLPLCLALPSTRHRHPRRSLPTCWCKRQIEQYVRQRHSAVSLFPARSSFLATQLTPSDHKVLKPLNYIASPSPTQHKAPADIAASAFDPPSGGPGMQGGYRLLASLMPLAAQSTGQQIRQYKSIVVNGNVSKAMRQLNTHIKEEKLLDKWRAAEVHVKPSHQRVIQQKEAKKKLNRQKFKSMMYWVMQAKSRYIQKLLPSQYALLVACMVSHTFVPPQYQSVSAGASEAVLNCTKQQQSIMAQQYA